MRHHSLKRYCPDDFKKYKIISEGRLNTKELIERRIERHKHRMTKTRNKNKNKVIYHPGDRVMLQNVRTKDFLLNGMVENQRTEDGGKTTDLHIPDYITGPESTSQSIQEN